MKNQDGVQQLIFKSWIRTEEWHHKTSNLRGYAGIACHIQKEQDDKTPLPKISLLVQIVGEI